MSFGVLIGEPTANPPWIQHEIVKAWNDHRCLFGIYIHNLKEPRTGTCSQGINPFSVFFIDAYSDISSNLAAWVGRCRKC
jgi:MTH538 TIR-like domain (DUF1863)